MSSVLLLRSLLFCLLFLVSTVEQGIAQRPSGKNEKKPILVWATGGIGVIAPGFGGVLRLACSWDNVSSLSAKYEAASSIDFFNLPNDISEWSIYYGRQFTHEFMLLRVAAGPGYFTRDTSGTPFHRIGIGFEAEAMLKFKFIGVGLMFTFMYAEGIALPGFTVNFSIGKLD